MIRATLTAAALLLLGSVPASAQQAGADSTARFLETARTAAEKYRDRSVAIREGFRRVGPDFPGMGEHWVQPGRLVSGRFIAEAPPILTYATFGDSVTLTGLAYALPLGAGENAPEFPGAGTWHDHSRSVDEESLLIAPLAAAHHAHGDAGGGPRLAMLHAWLWTSNPEGVFAQDNWALPYARLGLPVPDTVVVAAARALSLLSGGDGYQLALLRAAATLSDAEAARMQSVIAEHTRRLRQWHDADALHVVSTSGTRHLAAAWEHLWADLLASATPAVARQLRRFADPHAGN